MRWIRNWLRKRKLEQKARELVAAAFVYKKPLAGTSLKPRHANRWVLQGFEVKGDEIVAIRFGIVRHPRPYAFSRQSHKVLEFYVYDVENEIIQVTRGENLTRGSAADADD